MSPAESRGERIRSLRPPKAPVDPWRPIDVLVEAERRPGGGRVPTVTVFAAPAHEIKNPLTPIKLTAERLLRKHRLGDPKLGETLEQGVEVIIVHRIVTDDNASIHIEDSHPQGAVFILEIPIQ